MRKISLNGQWTLRYDGAADQPIQVPGVVERVLADRAFAGPFVYEKRFELETVAEDMSYVLQFAAVSYYCEVYCNGTFVTAHEGVWDPFKADVSRFVRQGVNMLTVKVTKPDFDKDSPYFFRSVLFGFIPDVMLPFGGIWKDVALLVKGKTYFDHVYFRFETDKSRIVVESQLAGASANADAELLIQVTDPQGAALELCLPYTPEAIVELPAIQVWSPAQPRLYDVEVQLRVGGIRMDRHSTRAGFRRIEVGAGGEILLNGEPFYMRGVIHWGCYPDNFTPTPSYEEVKDELTKLKASGFNAVKHCLYFPPSYYYELCDEMGFVTWQELPLWLPYDNEWMLGRVYDQYPKMLKLFMHYPSVSLVSLGCELDATIGSDTLNDLYNMVKLMDRRMVICDNSGSGECFEGVSNASTDIYDYHFYAELYNLDGLINEFTRSYREVKPWLFGEYNDCDTFRLTEKIQAAYPGNAWWVDPDEKVNLLRQVHKGFGSDQPIYEQAQILDRYGIANEVQGIQDLSCKQMHSIRKYILELTRSYNEIKGYNITTIKDVPITTSGVFDEDMQPKIDPRELLRVNGDIVVSFNKDLNRIWDNGADRFLNKDLYNFFSQDTAAGRLSLSNRSGKTISGDYEIALRAGDEVLFRYGGTFVSVKNKVEQLAQLNIALPEVAEVTRCRLSVKLVYADSEYSNDWELWVYPRELTRTEVYLLDYAGSLAGIDDLFNVVRLSSAAALERLNEGDILVTTAFDEEVERFASERGLRVIVLQKGEGCFPLTYNPFYREGVKAIFDHPVTDRIGHIGYAGMQFFGVGTDRYFDKLELEAKVGPSYTPIIRRYDARKFKAGDYLFAYEKGKSKLLVTSLNLDGGQGSQPYSFKYNNFAIWLLHAMISFLEQEGGSDSDCGSRH